MLLLKKLLSQLSTVADYPAVWLRTALMPLSGWITFILLCVLVTKVGNISKNWAKGGINSFFLGLLNNQEISGEVR